MPAVPPQPFNVQSIFVNGLFNRPQPANPRPHNFPSHDNAQARQWLVDERNWNFQGSPTSKENFQSYLPLAWEITGINFGCSDITKSFNKIILSVFSELGQQYDKTQAGRYHRNAVLVDNMSRAFLHCTRREKFALHFETKVPWSDIVGGWLQAYFVAFMGVFLNKFNDSIPRRRSQAALRGNQAVAGANQVVAEPSQSAVSTSQTCNWFRRLIPAPVDATAHQTIDQDQEENYMNYLLSLGAGNIGVSQPSTDPVDLDAPLPPSHHGLPWLVAVW